MVMGSELSETKTERDPDTVKESLIKMSIQHTAVVEKKQTPC